MDNTENINSISLAFKRRRIKLEELKRLLPVKIYEHLNYLLIEKNLEEFDVLLNTTLERIGYRDGSFQNEAESDLNNEKSKEFAKESLLRINDLEEKIKSARLDWVEKNEIIQQLKIELANIIEEKLAISSERKQLYTENLELRKSNTELQSQIQQNRIDEKVPDYVKGVKKKLQQDDTDFTAMSYNWAIAGIIIALLAIIAAFVTFFIKIDIKGTTLTELFYYFSRGLLGVALLSWLSFFCLSNSKKYTHEAIIRKDRQHALMFGEVFLQIYGSTATKEDAINVFKDWNMSANSAFSDQTEQPPGVQSILSSLKENFSSKEKA